LRTSINAILAVIALLAISVGLWNLQAAMAGLAISRVTIGSTPATIFRLAGGKPAPVVVIAHGFAGSQQLMQPFAITFARNGYIAITFDFLGHGRNPTPLGGSITRADGATKALVDQLAGVVAFAKTVPGGDGRIALLGHSMASDIVVRGAQAMPGIDATIAVSMFSNVIKPGSPRDLLVIAGALEPAMLKEQGVKATAMASDGPPEARTTYGSLADGTARRFSFSEGVEHIGVLYSRDSLREALDWLDAVTGHRGSGFLDVRGAWLGLLFLGLALLARPLSSLLPQVAVRPLGAGLGWPRLLPVAIAPAVLTPLILWKAPTGFLPILLGDYLAAHFFVYGSLTLAGLWITGGLADLGRGTFGIAPLVMSFTAVAVYSIAVFGLPIDRYVASFVPIPARLPFILALLVGTLPYFVADEWLVRGGAAPPGAYAFTKLCFIVSLAIAVALNLAKLFFLIIIALVVVLFFVVYGLFSGWAYRATRHPLVGALANALAFAWAIAVTFPILRG
jgi:hypothetical protein